MQTAEGWKLKMQVVIYYVEGVQQWTVYVMVPLWTFTVNTVCGCAQVLSDTRLTWCSCTPPHCESSKRLLHACSCAASSCFLGHVSYLVYISLRIWLGS